MKRCFRPRTQSNYRDVLGSLVRFLGRDYPTRQLTWRHVLRWLDSTDTNAVSRQAYTVRVGVFCRLLVAQGALASDVSKEVPLERPPDNFAAKLVTDHDLNRVVASALASPTPYIADVAVVAFEAALRLGELCAMRRSWVDLERRRLTIRQDETFLTKSGREVTKPLSGRALEVLARRMVECRSEDDLVFKNTAGRRLEPKATSKQFKKVVRAAGLPEAITFHGLCHGGITKLIAGGCSVEAARRFAGHSRLEMTMRHVHLLDDQYADQVLRALER